MNVRDQLPGSSVLVCMSTATEASLLGLLAAAAGGLALAAGDLPFTIIFTAMSWVALGYVLRHRD
jgi:hypothetical protein